MVISKAAVLDGDHPPDRVITPGRLGDPEVASPAPAGPQQGVPLPPLVKRESPGAGVQTSVDGLGSTN